MTHKIEPRDWRITAFQHFCSDNGVEILIDDQWRTRQRRFIMRRPNGRETVERLVGYEALDALLPTIMARGMLNELEKMEGKNESLHDVHRAEEREDRRPADPHPREALASEAPLRSERDGLSPGTL